MTKILTFFFTISTILYGVVPDPAAKRCAELFGQLGRFLDYPGTAISTGGSGFYDPYLSPNELAPKESIEILKAAPSGVYVTVGTDRGFNGVSLAEKSNGLVLVDSNADVTRFNRVNIALLKLSNSRSDYLDLRLHGSQQDWRKRLQEAGIKPPLSDFLLDNWKWWKANVQDNKAFSHINPGAMDPGFTGANYLQYDAQFNKVQALAKEGKIETHLLDLSVESGWFACE